MTHQIPATPSCSRMIGQGCTEAASGRMCLYFDSRFCECLREIPKSLGVRLIKRINSVDEQWYTLRFPGGKFDSHPTLSRHLVPYFCCSDCIPACSATEFASAGAANAPAR